ncbi:MAG: glutamate dehydrogenase/leucine dehydrogenase, partial [Myxococcota bacterium]
AFGRAVASLDGQYFCGPDVGTGEPELAWVREGTGYVNSRDNDASEATARGVLAGIRAVRRSADIPVRPSVLVQGVGRVGARLVAGLPDADLILCDTDPARLTDQPGAVVPADHWFQTSADLFAPCAIGPVVTADNVDTLPYRAICGSANTQLADTALADTLHRRGVVYAPDFIVNAGAVIEGVLVVLVGGEDVRQRVATAIDAIEIRVFDLLEDAARLDRSPLALALAALS